MTTPAQPTELTKARSQLMMGAALVMGGCTLGGLTAVVLMALNQRTGAIGTAIFAVVMLVAGVVLQVSAVRKMKAAAKDAPK